MLFHIQTVEPSHLHKHPTFYAINAFFLLMWYRKKNSNMQYDYCRHNHDTYEYMEIKQHKE